MLESLTQLLSIHTLFFFILGAIMGSFLLVVTSRMGVRTMRGRSRCDVCNSQLRWFELIPILSYLVLGGRCKTCKSRIPSTTLWTELILGSAFAVHSIIASDTLTLIAGCIILSLCAVLALYDARTQFLPANYLWALIVVAFIYRSIDIVMIGQQVAFELFLALIPAVLLGLLAILSKERLMGAGDPLLLLALSLIVGDWQGALMILLFASWAGLVYVAIAGLIDYFSKTNLLKSRKIAFGPFLIIGFLLAWWLSLGGYTIV